MSIWVELGKDKEKSLREEAKRHGMDISDYARTLLERDLPGSSNKSLDTLLKKGMFPQLKSVSEEDFKKAEWLGQDIEL